MTTRLEMTIRHLTQRLSKLKLVRSTTGPAFPATVNVLNLLNHTMLQRFLASRTSVSWFRSASRGQTDTLVMRWIRTTWRSSAPHFWNRSWPTVSRGSLYCRALTSTLEHQTPSSIFGTTRTSWRSTLTMISSWAGCSLPASRESPLTGSTLF